MTIDPWRQCKAEGPAPAGWALQRAPECNRPMSHEGDHWEADRRTFRRLAQWPADAPIVPISRPHRSPSAKAHARKRPGTSDG